MRRRLALTAALALAAASAACGGGAPRDATLRLELRIEPSHVIYTEGALYFVEVERGDFKAVRRFENGKQRLKLRAGDYELRSYARGCSGNCGSLDPPTAKCSGHVRLAAKKTMHVRVVARAGSACRLVVLYRR